MKRTSSFLSILMLAALSSIMRIAESMNWQGTGNMSNQNLTVIWSYINSTLSASLNGAYYDLPKGLSERLNSLWDPAWNVFMIIHTTTADDTILYGYAFRNHWMWFNNYRLIADGIDFVVWKDYNCQAYQKVGTIEYDSQVYSGFSTTQKQAIVSTLSVYTATSINDIWGTTYLYMNTLTNTAAFKDDGHAYSIVATQAYSSFMHGYVCLVGNNYYATKYDNNWAALGSSGRGSFVLFQTR